MKFLSNFDVKTTFFSKTNDEDKTVEENSPKDVLTKLIMISLMCIGISFVSSNWIAFNKSLWSISYAMVTGGISTLILGLPFGMQSDSI